MPTFRYPVVICRDPAGGFSAVAVDHEAVGFGATPADARADLRDYLAWFRRRHSWAAGPDFLDAELSWHPVMKSLGQWEGRVEAVVAELGEIGGALCAERLLDLARRGGFGPADSIAAFLVPCLARGEVRLVAEASPAELDACRRLLPGLPELFLRDEVTLERADVLAWFRNRVIDQPAACEAAADVFDTLMGVFDEGRLTDQYGRVTNFRSTVVVMTSNLGAGRGGAVGFGRSDQGPRYRDEAMRFFRPEFFNRMDAVVTFEPLKPESVRAITRRELEAAGRRDGVARAGVRLDWSERLVGHLAAVGFDARYGARPPQWAVERQVVAPLARWLLDNPGAGAVRADWTGERVEFRAG